MITVLYVDDEEPLLELGKLFLEEDGGLTVDTAVSAREALRFEKFPRYDAVISDYQMPGLDGIGFLKEIRRSGNTVPFILFTGKGREEIVIQALNEGADFYLQKGRDTKAQFAELAHIIHQIVRHHVAEAGLKASEERYRHVVEGQTEFISRFTPDGIHVFANDAYLRYFGKTREELIGHRFVPEIPREDATRLRGHFDSLTRVHPAATIEHRIIMPDGSIRWQQWSDTAFFDETGTITEYQSVGRDITENKVAEEALRDSEAWLRSVLASSPIPQFVIDRNHHIISWNKALEAYSGIRTADVLGTDQHWRAFYPEKRPVLADLLVENDTEGLARWYPGKLHRSLYVPGACESLEFFPHMSPAGKWLTYTASPIRDAGGTIIGAIETLEDITERSRAEEALRKSEEKYRRIIETSLEGIWILDAGSRVQYANSRIADLLGYSPDAMVDRQVADFVHPGDMADFAVKMKERRRGVTSQFERRYIRSDGRIVTFLVSATPITDSDGAYLGSFAMFTDITERKQAEEALRENAAWLKSVLAGSPTLQFVIDRDHRIISWNQALEEYSGIKAADVLGSDQQWRAFYPERRPVLADLLVDDKTAELTTWYGESLRKSEYIPGAYESLDFFPHMGPSGKWLAFTAAPIRDAGGDVIGAIETLEDITERMRMEEALRKSEEKYHNLYENAVIGIYRVTPDGQFLDANVRAARILGYDSVDELIRSVTDISTQVYADPERRLEAARLLRDHGSIQNFETACRHRDGHIVWVSFNARVVRDADGTVLYHEGTSEDITDRKMIEKELRESESRNRGILASIPDLMFINDREGIFLDCHAANEGLLAVKPEQFLHKSVCDVLPTTVAEQFMQSFRIAHDTGQTRVIEYELDTFAGRKYFEARITPMDDRRQLTIVRDISDPKLAEEALRQANRKLNLLTSITRHDIKNQLHALKGYLELSLGNVQDSERITEYLRGMERVASSIERQILFTKEFEHLGAGRQVWQNVRECAALSAQEFEIRGVSVDFSGLDHVEIRAAPMLRKIFYNLIDNALRYGGSAMTVIRFSSRSGEGGFIISCENNGADIPAEDKERIFVRGFGRNTGDGLFLVRQILEMTGITIAETGEPGRGARFEIVVPEGAWRPAGEGT